MASEGFSWNWTCRKASTKIDKRIISPRVEVKQHPLQKSSRLPNVGFQRQLKSTVIRPSDPMDLILDGKDPLGLYEGGTVDKSSENWYTMGPSRISKFKCLEPWSSRKQAILTKFSSTDILTMTSCFSLQDRGMSALRPKADRLDDFEEGIIYEINDISPQDFLRRIDTFHKEICKLWHEDQRVKALKIVIQCSKLLTDSYNHSFYPTKFVHITNVLDTFGDLVYKRLKEKCEQTAKPELYGNINRFPDEFSLDMVPTPAQETCRNWFYKIASIRELIPRLYVEAALLRSYAFITIRENGNILRRLDRMVYGIGDPMVALYLHCYLCRVALEFGADDYDFFLENFTSFLDVYEKAFENCEHLRLTMEFPKYLEAMLPALQWMFEGVIARGEPNELDIIQTKYMGAFESMPNNTLLCYLMLTTCRPRYIATREFAFLKWITDCNYQDVPLHKLLFELGRNIDKFCKENHYKLSHNLLEEVWPLMSEIKNCNDYLLVVDQWLPLCVERLSAKRVNELLNDVIEKISKDTFNDRTYVYMENFMKHLSTGISDFMSLLIIENFQPFLNLFRMESVKVNVCKTIMEAFVKRSHETFITDTVILNNSMHVAKILHDSISALTVEDEKKQISNLIAHFIRRIDFGRDFEKQLDFYVEARGVFYNLDNVHAALVQCVNKLSFETLRVVKGRHTSKTSAFVRACAAYCFTTIPSIASPLTRLQLNIISSQTALANQCLGQADAYFNAILDSISDVQKSSEDKALEKNLEKILICYIKEVMSILLVAPNNPSDEAPLYLIRGFIKVLQSYPWEDPNGTRAHLYIQILHMLCVAYQDQYPYHFFNVDSNDVLYASDSTFREEVENMCSEILEQILEQLHVLGLNGQNKKQAALAYELLYCVLMRADVCNLEMARLAANLWNLGRKSLAIECCALQVTRYCLDASEPDSKYAEIFSKLLAKFS